MAQLKIDDKIAELTLGHKIVGIEAVYNRNSYFEDKSDALARLGAHFTDVLNAPSGNSNVVQLRAG
jgi:hypothetical protein